MNGAELMVAAIRRQGVGTVFGLPGHLEGFFGALEEQGVRLIHMRHEAAVVMAADGYARARRGVAVACVTAGPGFANAVGGLASAFEAGTPLVLLTGRNPLNLAETGALQDLDHTRVGRSMTKWSATVHEASRLGEYIDRACRIALSGRPGPVLLEIPADIAQAPVDPALAAESLGPLVLPRRPTADPAAIAAAAELLAAAERPLVIAGNGAYWGDGGAGLRRLAGEWGLPVLARGLARGLVSEDLERSFPWPLAFPAAAEADVVLVAGCRMGTPISFAAPPFFRVDARFIQIDIEAGEIGRNRPVAVPVVGDCGPALAAIADALARQRVPPGDCAWVAEAIRPKRARIEQAGRDEEGLCHPLRMARELAARLPADAILIGDGANCLSWFKGVLTVGRAPGWMDHEPFGSMGVGLPMAIGAAAAGQETGEARPVFLGTGDGAFGQYLAELATAALHGLPIFIMLANDGGWGASRNIERRLCGRAAGVDMNRSRYDLVAQGLDCHGELASRPAEIGPAFDRALAAVRAGRPALVNVLVDRESGAQRVADPAFQMVPFNEGYFARRSSV